VKATEGSAMVDEVAESRSSAVVMDEGTESIGLRFGEVDADEASDASDGEYVYLDMFPVWSMTRVVCVVGRVDERK